VEKAEKDMKKKIMALTLCTTLFALCLPFAGQQLEESSAPETSQVPFLQKSPFPFLKEELRISLCKGRGIFNHPQHDFGETLCIRQSRLSLHL
jgi:hypothetical protein